MCVIGKLPKGNSTALYYDEYSVLLNVLSILKYVQCCVLLFSNPPRVIVLLCIVWSTLYYSNVLSILYCAKLYYNVFKVAKWSQCGTMLYTVLLKCIVYCVVLYCVLLCYVPILYCYVLCGVLYIILMYYLLCCTI